MRLRDREEDGEVDYRKKLKDRRKWNGKSGGSRGENQELEEKEAKGKKGGTVLERHCASLEISNFTCTTLVVYNMVEHYISLCSFWNVWPTV